LAFGLKGNYLISGADDNTIYLYDVKDGFNMIGFFEFTGTFASFQWEILGDEMLVEVI
jgi:WD40 repeat protein